MEKLIETLENNTNALETLEARIEIIKESTYYKIFSNENKRAKDIEWTLKIKQRVLGMRHKLLENIQIETNKQLFNVSKQMRQLKVA